MRVKLRILGLALMAVFAFAAVSSAAAEADTAHWTIEGATFSGSESISVASTPTAFELSISSGLKLKCTSVAAIGGEIKETNKDSVEAFTFSGCIVSSNPTVCKVKSTNETTWGNIKTEPLKSEVVVVTPGVYDKFEPASGTTFTEIEIEKSGAGTCPVSTSTPVKITGAAAGEGVISNTPAAEAVEQSLTFSTASAGSVGTVLKYGASTATFTGKVNLKLSGSNVGKKWGIEVTNP